MALFFLKSQPTSKCYPIKSYSTKPFSKLKKSLELPRSRPKSQLNCSFFNRARTTNKIKLCLKLIKLDSFKNKSINCNQSTRLHPSQPKVSYTATKTASSQPALKSRGWLSNVSSQNNVISINKNHRTLWLQKEQKKAVLTRKRSRKTL